MKVIVKCPVCGSKEIKQKFTSPRSHGPIVIGGEHTTLQAIPDGSTCLDCGINFAFNKGGKCDLCDGTGKVRIITSSSGIEIRSHLDKCRLCGGSGEVVGSQWGGKSE